MSYEISPQDAASVKLSVIKKMAIELGEDTCIHCIHRCKIIILLAV